MTLSADILALSPVLYWKLDDASGPAASDSSGNGRAGTYGGSYVLHQYGPEPSTFAVQVAAGGQVSRVGMVQPGTSPFTVLWYGSYNLSATPTSATLAYNGGGSVLRGWSVVVTSAGNVTGNVWNTVGSPQVSSAIQIQGFQKFWHAYAIVCSGAFPATVYVDGAATTTSSTGTPSTVLAADSFVVQCGYGGVMAHVAYYDKVLSAAQITQIHSYRYDWPFGPMINQTWPSPPGGAGGALSPSDPVVVDLNADLDDIRRAVIHDYTTGPPP